MSLVERSYEAIINHQPPIPNPLAADANTKGILEKSKKQLKELLKEAKFKPKPLLICSGGTSSQCAADGLLTIDLRKNFQGIKYDEATKQISIAAGNTMGKLIDELSIHQRSFPIGLSKLTGFGYILTGGISPLSRTNGLAIDQIKEIRGLWGNGNSFIINRPDSKTSIEEKKLWRGLCGAAPFLGIITSVKLQTQPIRKLKVSHGELEPTQLAELIQCAEESPKSHSYQWFWNNSIRVYEVIQITEDNQNDVPSYLKKIIGLNKLVTSSKVEGLHAMPRFESPTMNRFVLNTFHSEVLGLLGPAWGGNCPKTINSLAKLMKERPNPRCSLAAQQLGGVTCQISREMTSFIHRNAIWKPWITASWPPGDQSSRDQSLKWLEEVWNTLEPCCPGVHLAQLHPHLPWHKKEIDSAFNEFLPELQKLKSSCDPNGLLPPL